MLNSLLHKQKVTEKRSKPNIPWGGEGGREAMPSQKVKIKSFIQDVKKSNSI